MPYLQKKMISERSDKKRQTENGKKEKKVK